MNSGPHHISNLPRRRFLQLGITGGLAVAAHPLLMRQLLARSSSGFPQGPGLEIGKPGIEKVIRKALEKGGDFAEIFIENKISRSVQMEKSSFTNAVFNIRQGAGIRVISGRKSGYAYTEEITEEKLLRTAEIASFIARETAAVPPSPLGETKRDSFITERIPLGQVVDEKRLEILRRANDAALEYDGRIKMASISYYDEVRGRTVANSEGVYLSDALPLVLFVVQTLGEAGGRRHMSRDRICRHSGFEIFDEIAPETVARNAARESIVMLDAREAPAGIMDIVIKNGWGGVLIHEAIGHPLEADFFVDKTGAFAELIGRQVASPLVSIVDDGSLPNFPGTCNFDDEGTQMKRTVLIENGRLLRGMTDILSAKQLGVGRTGNGRRESYRQTPQPRMTNTFLDKGKDNPADIVASTKKGLYVRTLLGGSVDPTTGVFNFNCSEAYLIENGKITFPVMGATLISNCLEAMKKIDAVGNDLDFAPGICGKSGQWATVGCGQPTLRIQGLNVGGTKAP